MPQIYSWKRSIILLILTELFWIYMSLVHPSQLQFLIPCILVFLRHLTLLILEQQDPLLCSAVLTRPDMLSSEKSPDDPRHLVLPLS